MGWKVYVTLSIRCKHMCSVFLLYIFSTQSRYCVAHSQNPVIAHTLCNLQIAHVCYAISRLPAQSWDFVNAQCNLETVQDIYMERFCFRQCCDFGVSNAYCIWCEYATKMHVTEPQNISNLYHYLKESIVQHHQKWKKTTDKWFSTYTKSYVLHLPQKLFFISPT